MVKLFANITYVSKAIEWEFPSKVTEFSTSQTSTVAEDWREITTSERFEEAEKAACRVGKGAQLSPVARLTEEAVSTKKGARALPSEGEQACAATQRSHRNRQPSIYNRSTQASLQANALNAIYCCD